MGVAEDDRLAFVGLFTALIFVVGAPLVPLWGAWADKYSRKVVIVRSALVEAVVFAGVALSREPWQLAVSMLLIGLQLGNTGVMLAGIRDVTPRARLGTTIAICSAPRGRSGSPSGPVTRGDPRRRSGLDVAVGVRVVGGAVRGNGAPGGVRLAGGPTRGHPDRADRGPGIRCLA